MSVSERILMVLAVALGLAACSDDAVDCARTATFVLANQTTEPLLVRVPNVSDSVFVAPADSEVVLGSFEGGSVAGYPDLRDLMGCLTVTDASDDTLVFRLAPSASSSVWILDETSDCEGTFTLELSEEDLGSDADTDSLCADPTAGARPWSPAG